MAASEVSAVGQPFARPDPDGDPAQALSQLRCPDPLSRAIVDSPDGESLVAPSIDDVFAEHFRYIWRLLARLGAGPDAEDLAQEVFIVVHRRLEAYDPDRPIRPWLFGIAYNVFRDHRKRPHMRRETLATNAEARSGSSPIEKLEAAQLVHRCIAEIPLDRRAVFVAYELDQIDISTVAQSLDIPVNTAYSRLRTARQEFRAAVEALSGEAR